MKSTFKREKKYEILQNIEETNEKERDLEWYLFVKSLIQESLEKFKKSTKLHILYYYIQHEKLKNKFKALNELMISEETKANIHEEFALFRYKYALFVVISLFFSSIFLFFFHFFCFSLLFLFFS